MLTKTTKLMIPFLLIFALCIVGCSDDDETNPIANVQTGPTLDIVETAEADGRFTTLLFAADSAGLVDALKGPGPLTVFAPTDSAFAALPAGTVDALLNDLDALTAILTYHVVPGSIDADSVVKLNGAPTLNGADLSITVNSDGSVMIDGANVIITNIKTTNGIIHVIDAVITPPPVAPSGDRGAPISTTMGAGGYFFGGGWIARAIKDGRLKWLTKRLSLYTVSRLAGLSTLSTAVKVADLRKTLKRGGPFTLFGPTNQAFADVPSDVLNFLLNNPDDLANVLLYHVVPSVVTSSDIVGLNLTEATMANGDKVSISVNGGVKINDANVKYVDIPARNGVLHIIDGVLVP